MTERVTDRKCLGLLQEGKPFFSLPELKELFRLSPRSFQETLRRLMGEKVLVRLTRGLFASAATGARLEESVNLISPPSYISLETALFHFGISNDPPRGVTCVTLNRSRRIDTRLGRISFTRFPPALFFGFEKKDGLTIASPEKAVADTVFLLLRRKEHFSPRNLKFDKVKWDRLRTVLLAFPRWVHAELAFLSERAGDSSKR